MRKRWLTAAFFAISLIASYAFADEVRVSTAEELARAIRSDRTIVMESGIYDLSTVPNFRSRNVSWNSVFDGREILVKGVKNLTIEAEADNGAEIVTAPRYAFVLSFQDCSGLRLSKLRIGHKDGGECSGGVVRFDRVRDVEIASSLLYGSGTVGIEAENAKNLLVVESTITGCSQGALSLRDCGKASLESVSMRENEGYPLIGVYGKSDVSFVQCDVLLNKGSGIFGLEEGSTVSFSDGRFAQNETDAFSDAGDNLVIAGTVFEENSFPEPGIVEGEGEGEGEGAGDYNEVVIEFSGAAFLVPGGWTHELHDDQEGSASFTSPDGAAFGFFLPLDVDSGSGGAAVFDAGKKALDALFAKNVGFKLNLDPSGEPFTAGDIRRRSYRGGVVQEGKRITVKAEILVLHGKLFALCVMWQEGDDYEADADFIFENVRQLESVG